MFLRLNFFTEAILHAAAVSLQAGGDKLTVAMRTLGNHMFPYLKRDVTAACHSLSTLGLHQIS
jgi:hypothetical protein